VKKQLVARVARAIFIKNLKEKLKLRENFGTEFQQNLRTLQILKVMAGCRSNFV